MAHIPPSSSVCHLDSGILKKKKFSCLSEAEIVCLKGLRGGKLREETAAKVMAGDGISFWMEAHGPIQCGFLKDLSLLLEFAPVHAKSGS